MATKFPDLFAALAAEFDPAEVRTRPGQRGAVLRYVTARTVQNRLDAALGPENWWDRYRVARDNSTICSLTIRLPDGLEVTKEGIGVTSTSVGEDAEKGAESDAIKRAAVKFGIGRYLYPDSIQLTAESHSPAKSEREPGIDDPPPRRAERPELQREPDNPVPRSGKALYAWAREQQDRHDVGLLRRIEDYGKRRGFSRRMVEWSADEVADAHSQAVRALANTLEHREQGEALIN